MSDLRTWRAWYVMGRRAMTEALEDWLADRSDVMLIVLGHGITLGLALVFGWIILSLYR